MVVTAAQMREAEEAAFATGLDQETVMQHAGRLVAQAILEFFPGETGTAITFAGKGNNGGDAKIAVQHLIEHGWYAAKQDADLGELPRPLVLVDGLLGTGASGELRPEILSQVERINELRLRHGAATVAVDIPTGLGTETPVTADLTVTLGYAKTALLEDGATPHVGRTVLAPLPEIPPPTGADTTRALLTPGMLAPWLPRRSYDFHKGQAGRVAILAGGKGTVGAGILCATAAARAGAGLTTLFVPGYVYQTAAAKAPPEIMVRTTRDLPGFRYDVLAAGPGLDTGNPGAFHDLLASSRAPAVLDAGALRMLDPGALKNRASPVLLTPHPGEMEYLLGRPVGDRATCARGFASAHPGHTLLLKGARTLVATAGQPLLYNTSGHPGMATGGMGDVLTGLAAAFLASTANTHHAAAIASYVAGRAAELATTPTAPEPLLASDLFAHLGGALASLRAGRLL